MNALQAFLISHEILSEFLLWVEDIADKLGLNQMSLQVSFDRECKWPKGRLAPFLSQMDIAWRVQLQRDAS